MVTILIPQIGSLLALAWPVVRGSRWSDVRQDIGLTLGRQPWSLPLVGIGTYLSAQPVILTGALITLAMMAVSNMLGMGSEEAAAPIHPIVEPILRGDWTSRLQVLLVVVFAAVPEEIMFRGVLYRHLRELAGKFGYFASVLFAATISSFIFAAIHPQGLFGIPLLMGLAMVFALAREWRGTLIPAMIAHALVNAGTSSILFLIAD
jgi:membrane protease YdiL (CAAX protease family)